MSAEPGQPTPDAPGEEFGLKKGAAIGRYLVLGVLGRGGMGEVYAAFDPDLDRKIAVKLLRARRGADSADGRARLLREAQAIARLSHPNVVVVFDVGTFRESIFIAMEFVEGHTLGYWIQAQARRWREVLDVYSAAGRGLAAAHAAGLVHRDFKPDNVMITKSGQVRVMDFGLAREQGAADEPSPANLLAAQAAQRAAALAQTFEAEADADATAKLGGGASADPSPVSGGYLKVKLTQTGALLGTPAYMAPEQFAAIGGDARTDQFSFCVALYESLYGQRPFAGNTPIELMANVVAGTIRDPPPDARVPAWIRRILLRGLSTDPKDRYPSMNALLAALGQDPAARRRRWLGAAAGIAILIGATAGARHFSTGQRAMCAGGPDRAAAVWDGVRRGGVQRAFSATGSRNADRAFAGVASLLDDYVARWVAMYRETCEATHLRGDQSAEVMDLRMECLGERLSGVRALGDVFMTADPAIVDHAVAAAGSLPGLEACGDVEMLRSVIKPPQDPAVRVKVASVREEIARLRALGDAGHCQRAADLASDAMKNADASGYLPVQAEATFAAGRLGESCTDIDRSIALLQKAAHLAEAARHDEIFVEASSTLAGMYADRLHELPRAVDAIEHSRAVLSRSSANPNLQAWVADAGATVALASGDDEEALRLNQRAYQLRQQIYGPDHFDVASSLTNMSLALHALHRDAEALPLIARAVEIDTRWFGADSNRTAVFFMDKAEILTALGRLAEARAAVESALSTWRRQGADRYLVGYGLLDLGRIALASGDVPSAVATLQQSLEMLGDADRDVAAQARFALAQALWQDGGRSRGRAVSLARAARELVGEQAGSAHLLDEIRAWEASHQAGVVASGATAGASGPTVGR